MSMPTKFGIYVHWPYCLSKCPYCDFNSHVAKTVDHADWEAAYFKELAYYAALTKNKTVTSIFFGGGTPSLMPPQLVEKILRKISILWHLDDNIEITLEANPTSVEASNFEALSQAGVNRLSLGIQALNDQDLKKLGRTHSVKEALGAIELSQQYFNRASFDLIYARENQTLKDWQSELKEALKLAQGHLSLYQLTIEPQTQFYTLHQRGELILPDQEAAADMYLCTNEIMLQHGYEAYEVSNYAQKNQASVHNLTYWTYQDYIGIGPGAHGRVMIEGQKMAIQTHRAPQIYLERVKNLTHFTEKKAVSQKDQAIEWLMMGLRLQEGVDLDHLQKTLNLREEDFFDLPHYQTYLDEAVLKKEKGWLKVNSLEARLVLNHILSKICM